MLDFSDREEIKGWLDAIEPAERRREVAAAMAARAALRALPLVVWGHGEHRGKAAKDRSVALLPVFRAAAMAWASGKYPAYEADFRAHASSAAYAAARAASGIEAADVVAAHVTQAAEAASSIVHAVQASDIVFAAHTAFAAAFDATLVARADFAADFKADLATAAVRTSAATIATDAAQVESGRSGAELAEMPLWPNGAPDWATEAWRTFKSALLAANEGWEVWTDWYEARLAGDAVHPPIKALEVARATIPDDIWKQGPAAVNAVIKRLIDQFDTQKDNLLQRLGNGAVDFSEHDEVLRWLARIKPAQRRREVAVALAARAALRVLPLLASELTRGKRKSNEILSALVLPCLRAAAAPWVAAKYPTYGNALRATADAAARAAADTRAADAAATDAACAAARAAAATAKANADLATDIATDATDVAARAAEGVHKVANTAAYEAAYDSGSDRLFTEGLAAASADASRTAAVRAADAAWIDSGRSGAEFAGMPLWPHGAPDWATEAWRTLKSAMLAANEGWEVWTDWYDARLAGDAARPPTEALEVARATIPDEIWKQGPTVVNAEIKRLIAGFQSLQQRPAAFQFRVVDDKIDALPDDARPIDAETARDFYDEAKRKGQELRDRLQRAQADENIRAHVDLLLARLGSSYVEMRPGLMISALRSLESDVRAYDSEEGRKELAAAHLSSIFTLTESVRDLCAIFPRSREIEAEAVSLDLPMRRLPEIRETIELVVAKVNHSDGATEGGRAAINASAADLAHQRGLADEAKQSAYFLVDFANFTRAGVKYLKVTGRAVGGEIAGLGADSWRAFRRGAPKGVERGAAQAGKALVVGGVAVLMHWLGSDIAALGAMVGPYLPLDEMLKKMTGAAADAPAPEPEAGAASSDDADDAPAPRPSTPRKSKARKRGKK